MYLIIAFTLVELSLYVTLALYSLICKLVPIALRNSVTYAYRFAIILILSKTTLMRLWERVSFSRFEWNIPTSSLLPESSCIVVHTNSPTAPKIARSSEKKSSF